VTGFEGVALITGVFFLTGIGVGFLAVMAIPALVRVLAAMHLRDWLDDGWNPPGIGPPRDWPNIADPKHGWANRAEPDDRDDRPWWGDAG
jgi:hypothetical protein